MVNCVDGERSKKYAKKYFRSEKEERFEVTFRDGNLDMERLVRQILVDKETGVNYLCWKSGYGAAITPLLDSPGKVIVTK